MGNIILVLLAAVQTDLDLIIKKATVLIYAASAVQGTGSP